MSEEELKEPEVVDAEVIETEVSDADIPTDKKKKKRFGKDEEPSKEALELARLTEEFEAYKIVHLRTLAEYDNFRKRSASEKSQIYSSAVSDTVAALLPVADNMERAAAQENATAEDMKKGVQMILTQFSLSFEKLGITPVGELGEPFNPEKHNAVAHIDSEDFGESTVSSVFQKGYTLGDKVVRHAMVQVAN